MCNTCSTHLTVYPTKRTLKRIGLQQQQKQNNNNNNNNNDDNGKKKKRN